MAGTPASEYVDDHFETFLDDLFQLLAQPSISATGEGVPDCTSLAEDLCREYGFDSTRTVETDGQPAIIARADADAGAHVPETDGENAGANKSANTGANGGANERGNRNANADTDPDDDPSDRLTLLVYGHYDVQPVAPDEWTTPPFEPTVREGPDGRERIYARGAGDNKGQWFAHLCAIRALRETTGLPVNVTLLLEGEVSPV